MQSPLAPACPPGMTVNNQPGVAIAQEWMAALDAWVDAHGLAGYDPFDIKQHPWIRAAQPHPLLRKATTGLCDLAPVTMRKLLNVQPTENPKAFALIAMGKLRLFQLTAEPRYLRASTDALEWLLAHASPGVHGLAWGYPFDVHAKGLDTPAHTPIGVVSAIAGQAFCRAYDVTQETRWLEHAAQVAQVFVSDLPRLDGPGETYCFAYTPSDRRRVHNANLLVAEHLFRVAAKTGDAALSEAAEPSLAFTCAAQREDGAWPYGAWMPGDPYERRLMDLVDHHHTGFVLRSLHAIQQDTGKDLTAVVRNGFRYYKLHLQRPPWGMPINEYGVWPVDIHACAEAVLCPSMLQQDVLAARGMAELSLRWTHYFMRDRATELPYYRKYPRFTSRIHFPRWGTAWMYFALGEYLAANLPPSKG